MNEQKLSERAPRIKDVASDRVAQAAGTAKSLASRMAVEALGVAKMLALHQAKPEIQEVMLRHNPHSILLTSILRSKISMAFPAISAPSPSTTTANS